MSGKAAHRVGPYSKPNGLAKLDHRTREAKFMAEVRAQLLAHVGGRPTPPQVALIER